MFSDYMELRKEKSEASGERRYATIACQSGDIFS